MLRSGGGEFSIRQSSHRHSTLASSCDGRCSPWCARCVCWCRLQSALLAWPFQGTSASTAYAWAGSVKALTCSRRCGMRRAIWPMPTSRICCHFVSRRESVRTAPSPRRRSPGLRPWNRADPALHSDPSVLELLHREELVHRPLGSPNGVCSCASIQLSSTVQHSMSGAPETSPAQAVRYVARLGSERISGSPDKTCPFHFRNADATLLAMGISHIPPLGCF